MQQRSIAEVKPEMLQFVINDLNQQVAPLCHFFLLGLSIWGLYSTKLIKP